ncbi:MAG TPA: ROK family protein, partial [Fervidobacterium sp.]|nr:ROK family protein [Fervidobacterium sp.]
IPLQLAEVGVSSPINDEANLGMIAEAFHHEEIRKSQCTVFATVREGFGTGLWINGDIFRGPSYTAGEFGHTIFDLHSTKKCHCGNTGCLESIICISSFFGKPTTEWSRYINELFLSGDKRVYDYLETLARALTNIVNSLNPEYLIVGGELSGLDPSFYKELESMIKEHALEHSGKIIKVLPSTFTHDNYLYGALYAVIEEYFIPGVIEKIK